jgi:hypothetical protein
MSSLPWPRGNRARVRRQDHLGRRQCLCSSITRKCSLRRDLLDTRGEGVDSGSGSWGVQWTIRLWRTGLFYGGIQSRKSTACEACLAPTVSTINQPTKSTKDSCCRGARGQHTTISALRLYLGIKVFLGQARQERETSPHFGHYSAVTVTD